MRNKRVLPALLGSVALTLGLVTVTTSINKEVVNAAEQTATLSFANTAQRTEFSSSKQVWEQNGIKVINEKGSSTSNVADYVNPARFYASSSIVLEMEYDISKIEFDCSSSSYATALKNSIGSDATASGDKVTVTLSPYAKSFAINKLTAQVRMDSLTVTYIVQEEPENPGEIKTPTEEVNELLTEYYNNGSYKRDTVINLKNDEATQTDLIECFHAKCNILERETYFIGGELWMSRGSTNSYSYYGTEGNNVTYSTTPKPAYQPEKVSTAIKGETMESYYTTMHDIKDNEAEWTKNENVYSTSDATVIKQFLDFTAPCFLGLDDNHKNYWSMTSVEVEETSNGLELRLVTSGDQGKLTSAKGYLSEATITKYNEPITITNVFDALVSQDGNPVELKGTVIALYNGGTNSFVLADNNGNEMVVYSPNQAVSINDNVVVSGFKTTYRSTIQVASGSKVSILEEGDKYDPQTYVKTLEEAYNYGNELTPSYISKDMYTVSGNINIIDGEYYLTDGNKSIQLYNGVTTGLHQDCEATVTGYLTKYSSTSVSKVEIVDYAINEIIPCTYDITIPTFENGSVTSSHYNGVAWGTEVTLTITPVDGYEVEYVKVNGVEVVVNDLIATFIVTGNSDVIASFIEEGQHETPVVVTSKIDRSFTGVTGTSYVSWSNKTDANGITYSGQSAGGNTSIQLRSDNSNSGIIVDTNGKYKVKKVTIEWNSNTKNGRTLEIYGKTTKYTSPTDLYNDNKGTKIGSIVKGTSTTLEVNGDYTYIGFRSNSGAMYITSITIEWVQVN